MRTVIMVLGAMLFTLPVHERRAVDGPSSPIELLLRSASRSVSFPCVRRGVSPLLDQRHQDPQQKALRERAQYEQKINHCGPF